MNYIDDRRQGVVDGSGCVDDQIIAADKTRNI